MTRQHVRSKGGEDSIGLTRIRVDELKVEGLLREADDGMKRSIAAAQ